MEIDNNFWRYNTLSSVHIELSTKCNAACPGCARFTMNSPVLDPNLIQEEVSIETFMKWFPIETTRNIYNWIICGNLGDPMACKDIYEILEYIVFNSPGNIQVNTNGGLRSKALYDKIGNLFYYGPEFKNIKPNRVITFSIDGLKDTNHIYRRNVKWNKVWENLMAYVKTGATAHWDYLHFRHNSHQVEQARKLAIKHNINFILKNPFGVDGTAMPVYNKDLEFDYAIEHATDFGHQPYVPVSYDYAAPPQQKIENEGHIECMSRRCAPHPYDSKEITEIYVDVLGRVMPCCFVGNRMFIRHMSDALQVQQIQDSIGNKNNLHNFSIQEILDSGVLDIYSNSWQDKNVAVCWNQCGKNKDKSRHIDILLEANNVS